MVWVWDSATIPNTPVSPALVRNGLLDLGLGFILGTGFAFLLDGLIHPSVWNRNSANFAITAFSEVHPSGR
jgi:uncharacterized protein involved in exopolysaccharide biosynthesis